MLKYFAFLSKITKLKNLFLVLCIISFHFSPAQKSEFELFCNNCWEIKAKKKSNKIKLTYIAKIKPEYQLYRIDQNPDILPIEIELDSLLNIREVSQVKECSRKYVNLEESAELYQLYYKRKARLKQSFMIQPSEKCQLFITIHSFVLIKDLSVVFPCNKKFEIIVEKNRVKVAIVVDD